MRPQQEQQQQQQQQPLPQPPDIDWSRLDKRKFFLTGVGLFSGVTTCLFPLTVIKTRQMACHDVPAGLSGTRVVAAQIWAQEGLRGFYRGFGTVVLGTIPGRAVYLTALESTKSAVAKAGEQLGVPSTALAGISSACGGAAASLSVQCVAVPIDVVSQRLMVEGMQPHNTAGSSGSSSGSSSSSAAASSSGRSSHPMPSTAAGLGGSAKQAVPAAAAAAAGPAGQQRSLHASSSSSSSSSSSRRAAHATSSFSGRQALRSSSGADGWRAGGSRGLSTAAPGVRMNGLQMARLIVAEEGVRGLYRGFWPSVATFVPSSGIWWGAYGFWQRFLWERLPAACASPDTGTVVAVQTAASVLSGVSSSLLTNPLDLVKTRLQVVEAANGAVPSWRAVLRELLAEEGPRGLLRGVVPRMVSSACWGTAMVSVYEYLKRSAQLQD